MKITVLGIYGGFPYNKIASSSYLLQTDDFNLLIDAGSGSLLALEQVLDPLQLDAAIISHYHHDHASDVGVLQYYWQLHSGSKKEPVLPIYGHTQETLNFAALTLPGVTEGKIYNDFTPLEMGGLEITFLRTIHPVPAYAMRIVEKKTGKVLVYTADTAYFDELVEFSRDADLLIADTNFAKDKKGRIWHMTSEQVGNLAKNAHVKKLLLSHLPQEVDHQKLLNEASEIFENSQLATAFLELLI